MEVGARDAMVAGEKIFHRIGDGRPRTCRNAVKLAAIAGGEYYRFFENSAPAELARGLQRLLGSKCHALAKLHRRGPMVAADQRQMCAAHCAVARETFRVGNSRHQ